MTTPVDLDHLEKLHAAATQGEWRIDEDGNLVVDRASRKKSYVADCAWAEDPDGLYIAATHNALPALIAEVRALREVAEAAKLARDVIRFDLRSMIIFGADYNQAVKDAADRLGTALAKVPR